MKHITQGISDYLHDCWHDFLVKHISKHYAFIEARDHTMGDWYPIHKWKEGSVWHYIKQRKIAKKEKTTNERRAK